MKIAECVNCRRSMPWNYPAHVEPCCSKCLEFRCGDSDTNPRLWIELPAPDSKWVDEHDRVVKVSGYHVEHHTSGRVGVLVFYKHGPRPFNVGSEWAAVWTDRFVAA